MLQTVKKMALSLPALLMAVLAGLVIPAGDGQYARRLDESGMFANTAAGAYPQTVVAEAVKAHFRSPLPAGKSVKKCFVIGLDGARCDSALLLKGKADSGVNLLAAEGGLYIAAVGSDGTLLHTQPTKTAPGWTTLLTGEWAVGHGVWYNGFIKTVRPKTFLTQLVEEGSARSAVFACIWPWHVQKAWSTYRIEALYDQAKKLPVAWNTYAGQQEMQAALLDMVSSPGCPDILFSIYERPDEAGHACGYGNGVPEYGEAVALCDRDAFDIIRTIRARRDYASEDWLIIITSDHGGQGNDHGNLSEDCRLIFIASNKAVGADE